jgi:hypothetical protein
MFPPPRRRVRRYLFTAQLTTYSSEPAESRPFKCPYQRRTRFATYVLLPVKCVRCERYARSRGRAASQPGVSSRTPTLPPTKQPTKPRQVLIDARRVSTSSRDMRRIFPPSSLPLPARPLIWSMRVHFCFRPHFLGRKGRRRGLGFASGAELGWG